MFNPTLVRLRPGLNKCWVSPHLWPQTAYHWNVISSDYILLFGMVWKGRRALKTFLMWFCSEKVIENWFLEDPETVAEAMVLVGGCSCSQKWECCHYMINVLAAAGKAYRASSVIQYIFAWSHVVPAFKYPGYALKGWAKYQIIENPWLLYVK